MTKMTDRSQVVIVEIEAALNEAQLARLENFDSTVSTAQGRRMSTGKVRVYLLVDGENSRVEAALEDLRGFGFGVRRFIQSHVRVM